MLSSPTTSILCKGALLASGMIYKFWQQPLWVQVDRITYPDDDESDKLLRA